MQYDKFFKEGEDNSLRSYILHAPRGLIFDRSDNYLVDNQYIYDVNIIPKDFDQKSFNYALVNKTLDINKMIIKYSFEMDEPPFGSTTTIKIKVIDKYNSESVSDNEFEYYD